MAITNQFDVYTPICPAKLYCADSCSNINYKMARYKQCMTHTCQLITGDRGKHLNEQNHTNPKAT